MSTLVSGLLDFPLKESISDTGITLINKCVVKYKVLSMNNYHMLCVKTST